MALTVARASSQYAEATGNPLGANGNQDPFSMACWYKPSSIANGTALGLGDSNSSEYVALGMNGSGAAFVEVSGSTATAGTISNGVWAHIAGVQTNGDLRVAYKDGTAGTSSTLTDFATALDRVTIGGLLLNGSRVSFAGGAIAEAAVWNIALTAAEVTMLALGVSPRLVRPASLVFYAPLYGLGSPEQDLRGHLALTYGAGGAAPTTAAHPRILTPTGRLSISTSAATGTSVTPTPGVVVVSGTSPTIRTTAGTGLVVVSGISPASAAAAGVGLVVVTGTSPSTATVVTAPLGLAVVSGITPSVAASVTPALGIGTAAGISPSASATVTAGAATTAGTAPAASVTQTPTPGVVTVTAIAPAASTTVTPTPGVVPGVGISPTDGVLDTTPVPGVVTATGISPAASVATTPGVVTTVGVAPAIATIVSPGTATATGITPSATAAITFTAVPASGITPAVAVVAVPGVCVAIGNPPTFSTVITAAPGIAVAIGITPIALFTGGIVLTPGTRTTTALTAGTRDNALTLSTRELQPLEAE